MRFEPKSIADQIRCLAQLTGAPDSFVSQVKQLFTRRGISLEADATPYVRALEEAFQREESIRVSAAKARRNVAKLQRSFNQMGETYGQQIEQLKRIQSSLNDQARRLRKRSEGGISTNQVVGGSTKSFVARQTNDDLPMVPGPQDPQ